MDVNEGAKQGKQTKDAADNLDSNAREAVEIGCRGEAETRDLQAREEVVQQSMVEEMENKDKTGPAKEQSKVHLGIPHTGTSACSQLQELSA
jgi:hypothetical protein